jgi:hypothetical protein
MEESLFIKKGQEQKGVMRESYSEEDCTELGVLYRDIKHKNGFLYKYENNGNVFTATNSCRRFPKRFTIFR